MLDSICGPQKTYIRSYNIMIYHLISMSTMDIPNTISDNHITCFIGLVLLGKSSPETILLKTINYSGFHRFQCKKNIPWNQSDDFFFKTYVIFFCEKPGTLSHSRWVLIPPIWSVHSYLDPSPSRGAPTKTPGCRDPSVVAEAETGSVDQPRKKGWESSWFSPLV